MNRVYSVLPTSINVFFSHLSFGLSPTHTLARLSLLPPDTDGSSGQVCYITFRCRILDFRGSRRVDTLLFDLRSMTRKEAQMADHLSTHRWAREPRKMGPDQGTVQVTGKAPEAPCPTHQQLSQCPDC